MRRMQIYKRIMERIVICPDTGCWLWQGPTSGNGRGGGYPRMSLDGRTVAVHKVMFTHAYGYIPGNKQVDHICTNRCCINPAHLQLVSQPVNISLRWQRQKEGVDISC